MLKCFMALKNELNEHAEPLGEPSSLTCRPEEQVERSMDLPTRLRRFFQCFLKSQSGFSLAELMVAVGVSGTLALGTLQLAGLQTKAQMTDDLMNAQMSADMLIKNEQACTNTLNGLSVTGALPINIPNGLGKSNPEGVTAITRCQANGTNCGLRLSPRAADIAANNFNAINRSPDFVVFGNSVMVQRIQLTQFKEILGEKGRQRKQDQVNADGAGTARINSGIAEIRITFAVKDNASRITGGQGALKMRRVDKYILTPVSVDAAGNILNCQLPDNQAILEADYELCASLGGSYGDNKCNGGTAALTNATRDRMCERIGGSYNAGNGSCIPPWYSCKCPADQYIMSFDPNTNLPICSGGAACSP